MYWNLAVLSVITIIQTSLTYAHEEQSHIDQRNLRNVQEKVRVLQDTDCCPPGNFRYDFELHTDFFPQDTFWKLENSAESIISISPEYTEQFTTYTESLCLPVGCYTFTILDSGGNGLCCLSDYGDIDDALLEYYGIDDGMDGGSYKGTLHGDQLAFTSEDFSFGARESFCGIDVCTPTISPSPTEAPVPTEAPTNDPVECCPVGQFKYDLSLQTDVSPDQTSWELKDSNGVTVAFSPNMTEADTLYTDARCLPVGCYTFTIFDSGLDGLNFFGFFLNLFDFCYNDTVMEEYFDFDDFYLDYYVSEGFYEATLYGNQVAFTGDDFSVKAIENFCGIDVCTPTISPSPTEAPVPTEAPTNEPSSSVECCPLGHFKYDLNLKTDLWPDETSWKLKDSNGVSVAVSSNITEEDTLYTDARCLPVGCYSLTVYDSWGNGMCCLSDFIDDNFMDYIFYGYNEDIDPDGFYEVILYGNQLQFSGGSFDSFKEHSFCGTDVCAPSATPSQAPSTEPTATPSQAPSTEPTATPTVSPTILPSFQDLDTSEVTFAQALIGFFQSLIDLLLIIFDE